MKRHLIQTLHPGCWKTVARGAAALLLCFCGDLQAQQPPPLTEPLPGVTPASDKEETGSLSDMIPGYVDPLALPARPQDVTTPWRDDGSLFPGEIWSGETNSAAAPVMPPPIEAPAGPDDAPLSADFLASTFGPAPPPPLHDPQQLLSAPEAAELAKLLRDSLNARGTFQSSVVLLRASQQIPVALNPQDLLQRWHGSQKSLLVLYFMGHPERTQAFFSPAVRRVHRSEDLRQVVDFGVREAARMNTPLAQLQRFCYKTAIRLDRLHRQGVVTPTDEPVPVTAAAVPATGLWWAYAVGAQGAGLAAAVVWWWRRRRAGAGRAGVPVVFPEQDFVTRLGAPHCGGGAAILQFGAAQRP